MRRPNSRHLIPTTLLIASTMLLAGCFTLETTFTISDHGTVDLEIVSLIDTEELSEMAELFGQDIADFGDLSGSDLLEELSDGEDPCGELVGSLVDYEVTTREISEGSMVGVGCSVADVPFEDLTDLGADSFLVIEQDESGTHFELIVEGADELTGGDGDDLTELLGIDLDELFVLRFTASAPGALGDTNATSTDGATATWLLTTDAAFVSNGTATMTASWAPSSSGSSSTVWIIAAIIGALIVIGLVVLLVIKRSNSKSGDSPENPTEGAPPAPVTGPPEAPAGTMPATPPAVGDAAAPLAPPSGAQPPPAPPSAMPPPPPPSAD